MSVIVVSHTPTPELCIAQAARVCYASEATRPDSDQRLIKSIIKRGHESVLEHASITFEIQCSRVVTHELVRHRIASYSQRSQRYVKETEPAYFTPPELGDDIRVNARYYSAMENAWAAYRDLLKSGIKPEIARYVLPNACLTTIICTWNLREIRHIVKLRTSLEAQPEMREIAGLILEHALKIAPNVFADLMPSPRQAKIDVCQDKWTKQILGKFPDDPDIKCEHTFEDRTGQYPDSSFNFYVCTKCSRLKTEKRAYKVVADEMFPAKETMAKVLDRIKSRDTCHHEYSKPYQTFVTSWGGEIVNCKKCGKGTKLSEVFAQNEADLASVSQEPYLTTDDLDDFRKSIHPDEWNALMYGEFPKDPVGGFMADPDKCQHTYKERPEDNHVFAGVLSVVYQCTTCGLVKVENIPVPPKDS